LWQLQPAGSEFSVAEAEKTTSLPKKTESAQLVTVEVLSNDDWKRGRCQFARTVECEGSHLPQKCQLFLRLSLMDRDRIIRENYMCPFCMRHTAEQEC
jgi:hypothetical protein